MAGYKNVFKRVEKKYRLSRSQVDIILPMLERYMVVDKYGLTTICNIYFDTLDYKMIRQSIEKPAYKEKLRLRCYNVPRGDSPAFVELKKKVVGTVYKRRIAMPYDEAVEFLAERKIKTQTQITKEIEYVIDFYKPSPRVALFYDRIAMYGKEDKELRITIDSNMKWRTDELDLKLGSHGRYIDEEDTCILEIKVANAVPLWFSSMMSELKIYQTSFSKYGTAYKKYICKEAFARNKEKTLKGNEFYV
ncbi:MAG: polyphosphate polymerase domain-containing protein [Clostridia bacterium]|nr:polyphosphate polymerase domain-containing protein [Clostridia bacterium]